MGGPKGPKPRAPEATTEYISIKQLAELIHVHPHTIHVWIGRGQLGAEDGLRRLRGTKRYLVHWETYKRRNILVSKAG